MDIRYGEVLTSYQARSLLTLHGQNLPALLLDHQACQSLTLANDFKILILSHSPVLVEGSTGCVHISCYGNADDDDEFDVGSKPMQSLSC